MRAAHISLTKSQIQKANNGLCITLYCMKRITKKQRKNDGLCCYACKKRKYRERHPYENAYHNLRGNARRRGKDFSLTFEEFKEFAVKCFYIDKRGKHHNGLHIDRIDETRGYHADNIQPLTNTENIKKYVQSRKALEDAPF